MEYGGRDLNQKGITGDSLDQTNSAGDYNVWNHQLMRQSTWFPTLPLATTDEVADHDMPVSQTSEFPAPVSAWRIAAVCLIPAGCLLLACVIQAPYRQAFFHYDDFHHLSEIALLQTAEIGMSDYLLAPHNEHFIPLWKLMYYWFWQLFGCQVLPWHMMMTACQGVSSVCLFFVIRCFLNNTSAAAASALIWASAAMGGWDNPLVWIAASHLSLGVMWMLLAMLCLSLRCQSARAIWTMGMAAATCLALLTMGTMLLLCPVLPVQYWLIERRRISVKLGPRFWMATWLPVILLCAVLQFLVVFPVLTEAHRPPVDPAQGLFMTVAGYAAALQQLLVSGDEVPMASTAGVLAVLIGLGFVTKPLHRRVLLTFLVLTLVHTTVAYMARSSWRWEQVMSWGRFRYLPTLFWAVGLGVLFDAIVGRMWTPRSDSKCRDGRMFTAAVGAGVLLLGWIMVQQVQTAKRTTDEFFSANGAQKRQYDAIRQSLLETSQQARRDGEVATIPDALVHFWEQPHRLSQFAIYAFPEGLPNVAFGPLGATSEFDDAP